MKPLYIRVYVFLVCVACLWACGQKKSEPSTTSQDNPPKTATQASKQATETFSFEEKHLPVLKESLFFFIREQFAGIGENTFLFSENIEVNLEGFTYSAVMADVAMLNVLSSRHHEQEPSQPAVTFVLASYGDYNPNVELGDTVHIQGNFEMVDNSTQDGPLPQVTLKIAADYEASIAYSSPYTAYGELAREKTVDHFERTLSVALGSPKLWGKDELYLKARIHSLTDQDLAGLDKEALAYLRNEIFARHGHRFKTTKMKEYFAVKGWYFAVTEDATPYLNSLEKQNALFIKSKEG